MRHRYCARARWAGLIFGVALTGAAPVAGYGQTANFVAPPRTISDISAILDQEKPDAAKAGRNRADADANPPATSDRHTLAQFHLRRAQARAALGRSRDAIADCEKAISFGGDYLTEVSRYQQFMSQQYRMLGDIKRSIAIEQEISSKFEQLGSGKGRFFSSNLRILIAYVINGDLPQAEVYAKKNQALLAESKGWHNNVDMYRTAWEGDVEHGNARVLQARGRYREAELAYRKAQVLLRDAVGKSASWPNPPPRAGFESTVDFLLAYEGQAKARQGRLSEAEADTRRALLSRLKAVGKYHPDTAQITAMLANVLSEQARFAESEKLARTTVDIYRAVGYPEDTTVHAFALNQLAATLFSQRKWNEAAEIYDKVDAASTNWEATRAARLRFGWSRIFTSYFTGKTDAGIELARQLVERETKRAGDKHFDSAMAHAILATGLTYARRDPEALQEYKIALPNLFGAASTSEDDDTGVMAAADQRMQTVIETYIGLLSRNRAAIADVAVETFRLGESIRGRSVEKALSASSARLLARDPALADLVRKEQDLQKQIGAELGGLNNMLALPPGERDDKAVGTLRATIDKLRAERTTARRDIERRFPDYANLVAPTPATIEDIRAALKSGEAFLSFYLGRRFSFVWAVPKDGPVAFASAALSAADIDKKVEKLRGALEPRAATIGDIPPFDLALAHELYALLLKPVEQGWRPARNLIVVTNGAFGLLPLSLLPTAPVEIKADAEPMFSAYRNVPWLVRTHAVTMVPSAAALRTLRRLPAASAKRETVIGFGDPLFNAQQVVEALQDQETAPVAEAGTRGLPFRRRSTPQTRGIDNADLGLLPRLPDTAEELKSIALALDADPTKVVRLGRQATEETVKSSNLSKYRIIVFATHGLVPGDLSGLTQPALALSAPSVTGTAGDGLLTMEEILSLKLDADWVVLSACNTGAAAGAGAEAASGLGRAFFYAGTRAILVTNWSVHSASARELVSDLFRRHASDAGLTRGEALRQAMNAMIDGPGLVDADGKTMFTYAHPLFWAPYSIIGDGGGETPK